MMNKCIDIVMLLCIYVVFWRAKYASKTCQKSHYQFDAEMPRCRTTRRVCVPACVRSTK